MFQSLVIGAGVAGLAAARQLHLRGKQPVVLEARDRVGGRILTVRDSLSPLPVELGAEMVHGLSPALWDILRECSAAPVEMTGIHLTRDAHGLHPVRYFDRVGRIFETMAKAPEQSFDSFIRRLRAPGEAKQAATQYVEGFNAARREDVSIAWLNKENEAAGDDGERAFRLVDGYDVVPAHLSRGLEIRLSTVVRRIRWRKGRVTAETDRGEFVARRAIVALPFSLLRAKAIEIDPEPAVLAQARDAIATGNAIRITFRFREAFWETYKGLSFLHGNQPFPVWWTAYPVRAPLITGWAAGPRAEALAGLSRHDLIRTALSSLREIAGEEFEPPQTAHVHDWRADEYAMGAYSYIRVNGLAAQAELSKPLLRTLCFAGEALDLTGHVGTVHGAVSSGLRAALSI